MLVTTTNKKVNVHETIYGLIYKNLPKLRTPPCT